MKKLLLVLIFGITSSAFSQTLEAAFQQILKDKKATAGVSVYDFSTKKSYGINRDQHFPLQSVFKFHIALVVLDMVDKGKLSLSQKVYISKERMEPDWYSPLRDKYPKGNISLSLKEILKPTVSESDNVGCDLLLELIGGPKVLDDYLKKLGMKDIQIIHNEAVMQSAWEPQFSNYSSANSAVELLKLLQNKAILSASSRTFMNQMLLNTATGPNRIKGLLPKKTPVRHKTGTSGTNKETGKMAAINDIGLVTLPNGNVFALAVFVGDTNEKIETNERIIAEIARASFDYLNK
jgi:beta-lactamase class A